MNYLFMNINNQRILHKAKNLREGQKILNGMIIHKCQRHVLIPKSSDSKLRNAERGG